MRDLLVISKEGRWARDAQRHDWVFRGRPPTDAELDLAHGGARRHDYCSEAPWPAPGQLAPTPCDFSRGHWACLSFPLGDRRIGNRLICPAHAVVHHQIEQAR